MLGLLLILVFFVLPLCGIFSDQIGELLSALAERIRKGGK